MKVGVYKNEVGTKVNSLTAISFCKREGGLTYYNYKCDCGNELVASSGSVNQGKKKSCGCKRLIDIKGNVYGRLTAIGSVYRKSNRTYCKFICECGNKKDIITASVIRGRVVSCGCYNIEIHTKHKGKLGGVETPEYGAWRSIIKRCLKPSHKQYSGYGGRGITVCDEWLDYKVFLSDMGYRPSSVYSIDRIDNNKGYYKENCRWATKEEQSNNRRCSVKYTLGDATLSIAQWSRIRNIPISTIQYRIKRGVPIDVAVSYPVQTKGKRWIQNLN